MKLATLMFASLSVVLVSGSSLAGDFRTPGAGEAYANRNCAWCHGEAGKGFSTAPRLAGRADLSTVENSEHVVASSPSAVYYRVELTRCEE